MEKIRLIKIGGNVIDNPEQTQAFLSDFARLSGPKILVHGGGKRASRMLSELQIPVRMHEGRRITDAPTLEVIQMVYGGLINKNLTAGLQALGCPAVGLTGTDGDLIRAEKRPVGAIDYGFVGDVKKVNSKLLISLLKAGFCPVIAPLTHNGEGQILNTNADTIAGEISAAMTEEYETETIYCFEKAGVLRNPEDDNSVIRSINKTVFDTLKNEGIVSDGMIPKLDNAFRALSRGVSRVVICRADHLARLSAGQYPGTVLTEK